jgi:Spy/CpxP family protein refolding chaperone
VQDEQGMPLYEERPFVAPEVVDKKKSAAAPAGGAPAKSVFDRWFDGSKVVDAEGKPKVVYHGANVWTEPGSRTGKLLGDFNVFNRMAGVEIVGHPPSMDTVGSWFSSEPDNNGAGMYVGSKGAIYPVFLAIKNPWRPASFDAFLDKMHLTAGRDPAKQNPKGRGDTEALRAWLKKEGYDGILFPKGMQVDGDKQEVWVALEPTQIKSAIGNKGTFDPANPDIRYSRAPAVSQAGTPNAVRQQLRRGGLGSMVDALEQADRLRIISSKEADTGLTGVQGYTDPDGTITLISDQIVGDPVAVLLHEAFHSGAAELLGTPAWRKLMLNLAALFRQFEQSKGSARKFYDAARARVSAAEAEAGTLTEPLRVEEFAAYAIEEQASAPAALSKWVDEFIGTLKAWALKRFGRQLGAITPSQLKAIAKYALLEAVGTPGSPSPGMASRRRSIADVGARAKATITRERIGQEIGGRLTDLKPAALATVPLNYFSDLKRPGMVAVDQYLKVKRLMDAYRGNKHAKVDEVAQEWRKYARLGLGGADAQGRGRAAALAGLMHETTLAGIDPSSTSEEMESKAGYAELRARYLAMPRAGQDLYRKVRDTYREQADELDAILLDNVRKTQEIAFRRAEDKYREKLAEIEASKLDKLDKSKARKDAEETYRGEMGRATYNMKARMTKLRLVFEASRVPAPYFPLARFGKYFVTVRNLDGTVLSFSKKETDAERQRLERDMRQAYPNATVESGLLVENGSSRDMMDPRIVAEIETLLGDAGVDGKVMDMIWQRYLETMPDLSARKRFIHRKGVAGFDGDALRTFASNQFHAAHQMARLKFGLELTELTNQVVDQAKKADDQVRGMQLANELRKRHEWVMNPTGSRLAQGVTQMMFLWYLAATPAAAIINLTQTVMMGIPVLGARLGGLGKATAAIGKASADVVRGRGSVRNSNLSAEEQRAMDAFYESGMIERSQAHDLAGVGETGVAYSPWRHKMMSIVSWAYHNVEVWNREVTALAAYRMAREQGHHEGKAIDIAHDLTWAAHFDYSNSSRPRFMQGDVAKVALVFQSHQINMWYRLFRDIHQSVKGESAEARKEARYQLAGILGMMSLMGGMTGFFGYNVLVALAGLAFDDDDDPRSFKAEIEGNIVDLFGKDLGGMVLKGVPGHLLGIDLTSRLGMADFFIRAPDGGAEGRDWFQELIIGALGVAPSTFLNGIDGAGLIMQGDVARGVEVLAPKAIKDLLQAFRYANEGVLSRKGDVVLERDQLNALDVFVEAMGFTPAKVAETYERMGTLKDAEQHVLDERRALMNRFALAVMTGDGDAKRSAIEAIKQWNRKPYARAVPITSDGLTQSLKSRARNAAKRQDGVLIADPELGHLLRQLMPEHMN